MTNATLVSAELAVPSSPVTGSTVACFLKHVERPLGGSITPTGQVV